VLTLCQHGFTDGGIYLAGVGVDCGDTGHVGRGRGYMRNSVYIFCEPQTALKNKVLRKMWEGLRV
jgi:hypothetical protein